MKSFKKLFLALGVLLIGGALLGLHTRTALAANATETSADITACITNGSLQMTDAATITCKDASGKTLTFVDKNPADGEENYAPTSDEAGDFCDPGGTAPGLSSALSEYGIDLAGSGSDTSGPADLQGGSDGVILNNLTAYVNLGTGNCTRYENPSSGDNSASIAVDYSRPGFLQWIPGADEISPLNDVSQGPLSNEAYLRIKDTTTLDPTGYALYVTDGINISTCSGDILAVPDSSYTNNTPAEEYSLSASDNVGTASAAGSIPALQNIAGGSTCVVQQNFGTDINTLFIAGPVPNLQTAGSTVVTDPQGCSGDTCNAQICTNNSACQTGGTGNSSSTDSCDQNSDGWSFAWAVCPILDAASGLTNELLNLFESQLSFTVSSLGSTGSSQIQNSWSLIRDLSSAILVVIMLIMVFSQAIGGGPFDAYTIRKLLPRLAASVILIQISWWLVSYIIDLVNALGQGLADLLYWPFGGEGNMSLFSLLGHAGLGGVTLGAMDWTAILVFGVLTYAFLFTMLGMAFVGIVALLFALLTLVFRKILIIVLLIFAPLAIVAWILPGTERYYKLWRDNLMKVLFMYPLVIVIIAGGRIFAYITGTQDNGQFLNLIFIMVGFFGPLFILPKTFKWGGTAMTAAGNGIMKASSRVSERPKKYLDKRQEELSNQKGISAARRIRNWNNLSTGQKFGSMIRGDKFRSGEWDPAYRMPIGRAELQRQRQEKYARFRGQAVRSENEERDFAKEAMLEEASLQSPGDLESYFMNIINHPDKHTPVDVEAAYDLLIEKGGDKAVDFVGGKLEDMYRSGDKGTQAMGDRIAQRKADKLFVKLPFNPYYKGPTVWASTAKAAEFATISDAGLKRTVDELQAIIDAGGDGAADAQTGLNNLYGEFSRAVTSPSISPSVGPTMRQNIEDSLADGSAAAMAPQVRAALSATTSAAAVAATGAVGAAGRGATVTGPTTLVRPGAAPILGSSPGEIRTVHQQNVNVDLPSGTAIETVGSPSREAFKLQLRSSPTAVQSLAHGIAYGVSAPEHTDVLSEMRTEAQAAGTPEARDTYNNIVSEIQQAYQQRIVDTAATTATQGRDPAAARQAVANQLNPEIMNLEAGGTSPLSKLP